MGNASQKGKKIIAHLVEKSSQVDENELRLIFESYDTNGDKLLQVREAKTLIKDIIKLFLEHIDEVKHQGKSKYIEYDFDAIERNKKKWLSNEYLNKIMNDMDEDASNEISFEEFKHWFLQFLDYGSPDQQTRIVNRIQHGEDEDTGMKTINNYTIMKTIGNGSYATVKLAMHTQTNKAFAIKVLSKSFLKRVKKGTQKTAYDDIMKEINILKKLHHRNIVRLYEVMNSEQSDEMYMVMEYMGKGEVLDVLKGTCLSEEEAKKYFIDLIMGLEYVHSQHVVHRDIKPENLLVDDKNVLKITDFGISEEFLGENDILTNTAGTPAFLSPEACAGKPYSGRAADVWAAAVTLYCFLFGKLPFSGNTYKEISHNIETQHITFNTKNPVLNDLLEKLFDKNPDTRITINEIKKHEWIREAVEKIEMIQEQRKKNLEQLNKKRKPSIRSALFQSVPESVDEPVGRPNRFRPVDSPPPPLLGENPPTPVQEKEITSPRASNQKLPTPRRRKGSKIFGFNIPLLRSKDEFV